MVVGFEKDVKIFNGKAFLEILFLSLIAVGVIGYFDGVAPIPYLWKACGKICLFVGVPLFYQWRVKDGAVRGLLQFEKKPLRVAFLLGGLVFAVIFGTYLLFRGMVDLSSVTGELDSRMNINEGNFVVVAVYIALCNSFLEEFFFRGYLYGRLRGCCSFLVAQGVSAVVFALYHVAIMVTWFEMWVFLLCMLALVIGGVIFNLMVEWTGSLYPSWVTHGCANLAINSVGMILFYG